MSNLAIAPSIEPTPLSVAEELVSKFKSFRVKTVESVLEMARVVQVAHQSLSKDEMQLFQSEANIGNNSTLNKWLSIAAHYKEFSQRKSSLPSSWTTIYALTKKPQTKLLAMLDKGLINSKSTAREINQVFEEDATDVVVDESNQKPSKKYYLRLVIPNLDHDPELQDLLKSLLSQLQEIGCELKASKNDPSQELIN